MKEAIKIFKALSDPTRLRIVKLLENGELCVCQLTAALGMGQSRISRHLSILKECGLIEDRRAGKWVHYRLCCGDVARRVCACYKALNGNDAIKADQRAVRKAKPLSTCPIHRCSSSGKES